MIKEVKVTSGFAANLPCLKDKIEFKPGLNVLFGPNGCGKSTTLKIMGAYCGIKGGGWSRFPDPLDLKRGVGESIKKTKLPDAFKGLSPAGCEAKVIWDGTPSFLNHSGNDNPMATVFFESADESPDGMTDMHEQIGLMMGKPSEGQLRIHKLRKVLEIALKPPDLTKIPDRMVNDTWKEGWTIFAKYVSKLDRTGPATLLLDEPDKSLSIENQIMFWKDIIPKMSTKLQLIVASHSPFCINVKANFIDMQNGYLEETRKAVHSFMETK